MVWIALNESFAPRIKIDFLVLSHFDIVSRILNHKDSFTLVKYLGRLDRIPNSSPAGTKGSFPARVGRASISGYLQHLIQQK